MLGLYYRIWVDCIAAIKKQPVNKRNWSVKSMLTMSIAMTFNLALVMIVLQKQVFGYYFYRFRVDFLPRYFSNAVSFIILFLLPCVVMNYLLIFRKDRYKRLLEKYPYHNGKLFATYFSVSLLLPVILVWIYIIFFQ